MEPFNPQYYGNLRFAENKNMRDSFIALFAFWIIWALLILADHGSDFTRAESTPATVDSASTANFFTKFRRNISHSRRIARNVFITMLWMVASSTLGFGLTRGSMILTWIYFVVGLAWVLVDLVLPNGIIDFAFGSLEFILALAVMGIGFSKGW
ncbi:hypothetical protein K493DRAFT_203346 [Basidiobolus meristosporus CBS 931.73]|uniref:Uncharacterized protein n=1 Tax=Basidiobolus meristosporus CBS 931.73 TaxID=1314790 RepID=A0A1Y1Z880_9FUNG|nr:hypothetical protein K493DRAFT_203346 [Basidiobolus meristosporus CBS 931.73]|eukprot:ORY06479.1 hypothetical protein K493DRAFT_203346 [Basidiobolus meristosporus CBS 931.73]